MESKGRASSTEPFTMETKDGLVKMLGTYTAVPDDSGWGVIVQVDESKAYYSALQMRRWSFALVALVTVVAIVLGTLFAGQISRPIQELARGARRLAEGDYSTRVAVESNNEVGVLTDSFNFMVEGGSELLGTFLSERRVDAVALYRAPILLGGRDGVPVFGGPAPARLSGALRLRSRADRALFELWYPVTSR